MTAQTVTLADFLLARITEDKARRMAHWHDVDCDRAASATANCTCGSQARVLAECEAKRRIVERLEAVRRDGGQWAEADGLEFAVRALAQPHADHPDFREEWRA